MYPHECVCGKANNSQDDQGHEDQPGDQVKPARLGQVLKVAVQVPVTPCLWKLAGIDGSKISWIKSPFHLILIEIICVSQSESKLASWILIGGISRGKHSGYTVA